MGTMAINNNETQNAGDPTNKKKKKKKKKANAAPDNSDYAHSSSKSTEKKKSKRTTRSEEEDDDIQKTNKIPKKKMPLEISQVENDNPAIAPPKKSNKNLRDTQKKPAPSSQRGTRSQQGRLASFSSLSDVGDDDPIDSYHNRYNRGYDMDEEEDDD